MHEWAEVVEESEQIFAELCSVFDSPCPLFMMLLLQALILHKLKSQENCYKELPGKAQGKCALSVGIKNTVQCYIF